MAWPQGQHRAAPPQQTQQKEQRACRVGYGGGQSSAGRAHIHILRQNEKRVQHDVQHAAQRHAGEGQRGPAFGTQQIGQQQVQYRARAAPQQRPAGVGRGHGIYLRVRAAKREQRVQKRPAQQAEYRRAGQAQPEGDGGDAPCAVHIPASQCVRHSAGAADAEEVTYGSHHQKGGIGYRNGGCLYGCIQQAHKKRVRQVVQQRHHLSGDGGQHLL